MINMLRALMHKVHDMQEQRGNASRKMEILRKNQKEVLEIKKNSNHRNNVFDGLISRLETAEERLSELEDISLESSKN